MRTLSAVVIILVVTVSVAVAGNVSGTWSSRDLFTLTFGADGTYRAECTDQQYCSLCAGGGPLVETGTYKTGSGTITITITSSNAPNKDQRIGKPITVSYQLESTSVTFDNARKLTFDWADAASITMVQKTTSVEYKTWRAVKELFR